MKTDWICLYIGTGQYGNLGKTGTDKGSESLFLNLSLIMIMILTRTVSQLDGYIQRHNMLNNQLQLRSVSIKLNKRSIKMIPHSSAGNIWCYIQILFKHHLPHLISFVIPNIPLPFAPLIADKNCLIPHSFQKAFHISVEDKYMFHKSYHKFPLSIKISWKKQLHEMS